jgi:putative N6-adenine-specific DNA methylase
MTYKLFAVTAPGLEGITRSELLSLGLIKPASPSEPASGEQAETGGVEFDARPVGMYQANLCLRTASRILARVGEFDAVGFEELRKKAARLGWSEFLRSGMNVAVRVTCHKSRLYHSDAVAREIVNAIGDALKGPVTLVKTDEEADRPPQVVVVRIVNDHCTVSMDSSGGLLHRRGYRLQTAKAPLRETLAAGLLMLAGWDGASPLIDPFCGSGTIPIEAALLAGHIAPGKSRSFAFMDWPNFKQSLWREQIDDAIALETTDIPAISGSDRDEGAIAISRENAHRAGVLEKISFTHQTFSALQSPAETGWIVTNPPYGVRVSPTHDLRNLYSRLGDVLREQFPGWHYAILCADPILAGHTRLKPGKVFPLVNGGIGVKLYTGIVPSKS